MPATFELFDSTLAELTPELFSLWTIQSETTDVSFDVSFDLNRQSTADMPIWRSNLPTDFSRADRLLTECEVRLEEAQKALNTVSDRIDCLVTLTDSQSTSDLAFGLPSNEQLLGQPEQELITALQELQTREQLQSFGIDFSSTPKSSDRWNAPYDQFQTLMKQAFTTITHYAWVETQIQGKTFARTAISWTGDFSSIWMDGVNAEQQVLHQRSLALALTSRKTLLQNFAMAVQVALKVSVAMSLPGGVFLTLPLIWKFINQIVNKRESS